MEDPIKTIKNLNFVDFVWALIIMLLVAVIVAILSGLGAFALKDVLPMSLIAVTVFVASFYPLYYIMNRTCQLCAKGE